jgi:hypothetical protein
MIHPPRFLAECGVYGLGGSAAHRGHPVGVPLKGHGLPWTSAGEGLALARSPIG